MCVIQQIRLAESAPACLLTNKYLNKLPIHVEKKLIEDAEKLLSLRVGDEHILKQILRAATNDEIISNRERSYVASLTEKHILTGDTPIVKSAPQKASHVLKHEASPSKSSNKTILIGIIVGVAVAAVAISFIAMPDAPTTVITEPAFMITLNAPSYTAGDFIDIRGTTDLEPGSIVQMTIHDSDMNQVWSWETITDSDGSFSALALAGYDGWQSGAYTVMLIHDDLTYRQGFEYME